VLRAVAAAAALLGLTAASAQAMPDANVGPSLLTYVCPNPLQLDFSWTPAVNGTFYSLQLRGPLTSSINGGVSGTYLRQFGAIEVAKGQINSASVRLSQASLANNSTLQWQLMIGGPHGYLGLILRQEVALVPAPCSVTTPQASPYF
jgi:hypothetical protein